MFCSSLSYFCHISLFLWPLIDGEFSSPPPPCYSLILISIILMCFFILLIPITFCPCRASHSHYVLIFPAQNYLTITFGRSWACSESIWLLLSEGISRVKRLRFLCREQKGAPNAWRTPAEWMLFTAERAAVLMMSAIKQQRSCWRSESSLLPPAI